jgi:dTDP-4-dehydrorhamnose reductase
MKKPMRIAITGASGLMGWPLYSRLKEKFEVIGAFHHSPKPGLVFLDLLKPKQVNAFVQQFQPDVLFHLAALTDVDRCEREPLAAKAVHVEGTKNVVQAVQKQDCRLVYFSTDFVFDGKKGNYSENDSTHPINVYGSTKLEGEKIVQSLDNRVIVRTTTPYSSQLGSKKFVGTVIERLSKGESVSAFSDLIRSPTLVENISDCMESLLLKKFTGILNVAGSTSLSMLEAALEVARVFSFDPSLVRESLSSSVRLDAPRPLNTSLDVSHAARLGLPIQRFEEGLLQLKRSQEFKK